MALAQRSQEYQTVPVVGGGPEQAIYDAFEHVSDVLYPESIFLYKKMPTDPQVAALENGYTLPLRRYHWALEQGDATEETTRALAEECGLPVAGEEANAVAGVKAMKWDKTLARILLAPRYGHYGFEIVRDTGDGTGRTKLAKLGPLPPLSLANGGEIIADKYGDIVKIRQNVGTDTVEIKGEDVAWFVWGEEDGGYLGTSILRPLFKPWSLLAIAEKIAVQYLEVAGLGTPVGELPEGSSSADYDALFAAGQSMRANPHQAIVIPAGAKLTRQGVSGTVPDGLPLIENFKRDMSKAMHQMVIELAQTPNGSRGLGDTFAGLLGLAQRSLAMWVCAQFTEKVLAPMARLNDGEDAASPVLVFDPDESEELTIDGLKELVDAGIVTADEALEVYTRKQHNLPDLDDNARPAPVVVAPAEPGTLVAAAGIPAPLAERGLRRALTDREIQAAADFTQIDDDWRRQLQRLLGQVNREKQGVVDELVALVEQHASDPVALASLAATPFAADVIAAAMTRMAAEGVAQVADEAAKQGVRAGVTAAADAELLAGRSEAASIRLADNLARSASNAALAVLGASPAEMRRSVQEHLRDLTDAQTIDELGGALTQAQNEGRRAAMDRFPDGTRYLASALLDTNACSPCSQDDGVEYASLDEALDQFPGGGQNKDCEGGSRCRCSILAIAPTESAPSVGLAPISAAQAMEETKDFRPAYGKDARVRGGSTGTKRTKSLIPWDSEDHPDA